MLAITVKKFCSAIILVFVSTMLQATVSVSNEGGQVRVTWLYSNPQAKQVGLLLNTNGFKIENALHMIRTVDGRWTYLLNSRLGQDYHYKYLVDGVVTEDNDQEKGYIDVDLVLSGESSSEKEKPSEPEKEISHYNFLDPGLSGSVLVIPETGETYMGANFQFVFFERLSPTYYGYIPMYFKWFFDVGLNKEIHSTVAEKSMIVWDFGLLLSFEGKNGVPRNFFIPYYGLKVGGISITNMNSGFYFEPTVGVSLLQLEGFSLNLDTGLFLNSVNLAGFLGMHSTVTVSVGL